MDIFEKQQRVDSLKGMVKARWFAILIMVALGLILKLKFFGWAPKFDPFAVLEIGFVIFGYNFIYWLFIRQPIEKIESRGLAIVSVAQVAADAIIFAIIFYYGGTIESINFILFFVVILTTSSLYKTRGIILAGILCSVLFGGIILAEYYGLIPHIYAYKGAVWFGIPESTRAKVIGFIFYMAVAVIFSAFLSNLFRKQIKNLRQERDKVTEQSKILTLQTQELTQAKDQIQGSLVKSDVARRAAIQARDEAEKANLELNKKIDELEKFYKITIGREVRIVELKSEIKDLKDTIRKLEKELAKK
jgi:hypothetical protein